ncbi:MAG: metal ABC transporter ATP-binding protein [Chloroflexota bacterium]
MTVSEKARLGLPGNARPALLLDRVVAGYDHGIVLEGVSATLVRGQVVALLGPNGAGKSTLLKLVLGLLEPLGGRVEVLGSPPSRLDRRHHQIGYVPQLREVDRAFPVTVFDLALMGRVGRLGLLRGPSGRDRALVSDALVRVGLGGLERRPFGTLSGGQQQRAFLARALAQEPDLLVLDEPAAGVDEENRARIGGLLSELRAQQLPMLIATHDVHELQPLELDAFWCLSRGHLAVETPDTPHLLDRHGSPGTRQPGHGHPTRPEPGLLGLDSRPPATI